MQDLPQFALRVRGIVSMRGWEMRWMTQIVQSERDDGLGSTWSQEGAIKPVRLLVWFDGSIGDLI